MTQMRSVRKDRLISSRLAQLTLENGLVVLGMVTENNNGLMVPGMKASGKTIELMVRANLLT